MRVVCLPAGRERDDSGASPDVCWKNWAATLECEGLKEGVWLEPSLAMRRKTTESVG